MKQCARQDSNLRVGAARKLSTIAGDGCFMMSAQELATAAHHGVGLVVVVVSNGMYGTIRMHQERNFPGRVSGTSLTNPNQLTPGLHLGH